jgi:hypothetical protein
MTIKKTLIFFALILIMFLPGCRHDEDFAREKIQFTFNAISTDASGGRIASAFPEGSSLLFSLEKSNGETVFTRHPVTLLNFGESVITEPLELLPGTYRITDFMLFDKSETVLYATPRRDSPLGNTVAHALPYGFTVSRNKVSNIEMEVVNARQHTPEDFGYVSFSITTVNAFSLSVFAYENGKASLTDADAYIILGPDTVSRYKLGAKINLLPFKEDPAKAYDLVVIKSGYARFTKHFTFNDLQAELGDKSLTVNLIPAFTLTKLVDVDIPFYFDISGKNADIIIDWGDRSSDPYTLDGEQVIEHPYSPGKYFITITGEIDQINEFHMFYDYGLTTEINFSHLPGLEVLDMGETYAPSTIDLSRNKNLTTVSLISVTPLKHIILPAAHHIRTIDVSSDYLDPASIDAIIDNIYKNVVSTNNTGGSFTLKEVFYWEDTGMIGPPSAEGINKLQQLRDTYHWQIDPNP